MQFLSISQLNNLSISSLNGMEISNPLAGGGARGRSRDRRR